MLNTELFLKNYFQYFLPKKQVSDSSSALYAKTVFQYLKEAGFELLITPDVVEKAAEIKRNYDKEGQYLNNMNSGYFSARKDENHSILFVNFTVESNKIKFHLRDSREAHSVILTKQDDSYAFLAFRMTQTGVSKTTYLGPTGELKTEFYNADSMRLLGADIDPMIFSASLMTNIPEFVENDGEIVSNKVVQAPIADIIASHFISSSELEEKSLAAKKI